MRFHAALPWNARVRGSWRCGEARAAEPSTRDFVQFRDRQELGGLPLRLILEFALRAPPAMPEIVRRYRECMATLAANPQLRLRGDIRPRQQGAATFLDNFADGTEENAFLRPSLPSSVLASMLDLTFCATGAADVAWRDMAIATGLPCEKPIYARQNGVGAGFRQFCEVRSHEKWQIEMLGTFNL
jgi:hypothetical protein